MDASHGANKSSLSRWRMNMAYGEHQLEIKLDSSTLTGEVQCDDFEYPAPPIPGNDIF